MIKPIMNGKPLIQEPFDETFFDDALDLFLEIRSCHAGKYIYGKAPINLHPNNEAVPHWLEVVRDDNKNYYLPSADSALLSIALKSLARHIPYETPIVDFGVGELSTFKKHIVPILNQLQSKTYFGIDSCQTYLDTLKAYEPGLDGIKLRLINMDFFSLSRRKISPAPALGVMLCSTIGNIESSLQNKRCDNDLIKALKQLSRFVASGWFLMSVDTNHDKESLIKGYATPAVERFVLGIFPRIAAELPVIGFDPYAFRYIPEWHPEMQLLAHMAEAKEDQDFFLGSYRLFVRKGQRFHLLNSYKFSAPFFEHCCDRANLDVLHVWHHESPMKLYLMIDRANPTYVQNAVPISSLPVSSSWGAGDAGLAEEFAQTTNIVRS